MKWFRSQVHYHADEGRRSTLRRNVYPGRRQRREVQITGIPAGGTDRHSRPHRRAQSQRVLHHCHLITDTAGLYDYQASYSANAQTVSATWGSRNCAGLAAADYGDHLKLSQAVLASVLNTSLLNQGLSKQQVATALALVHSHREEIVHAWHVHFGD